MASLRREGERGGERGREGEGDGESGNILIKVNPGGGN